jgi:hypothetical protein
MTAVPVFILRIAPSGGIRIDGMNIYPKNRKGLKGLFKSRNPVYLLIYEKKGKIRKYRKISIGNIALSRPRLRGHEL